MFCVVFCGKVWCCERPSLIVDAVQENVGLCDSSGLKGDDSVWFNRLQNDMSKLAKQDFTQRLEGQYVMSERDAMQVFHKFGNRLHRFRDRCPQQGEDLVSEFHKIAHTKLRSRYDDETKQKFHAFTGYCLPAIRDNTTPKPIDCLNNLQHLKKKGGSPFEDAEPDNYEEVVKPISDWRSGNPDFDRLNRAVIAMQRHAKGRKPAYRGRKKAY